MKGLQYYNKWDFIFYYSIYNSKYLSIQAFITYIIHDLCVLGVS